LALLVGDRDIMLGLARGGDAQVEVLAATKRIMDEQERSQLVDHLARNPLAGDLIPGTGGVRKLRWALEGRGKRGGARVVYYYHNDAMPIPMEKLDNLVANHIEERLLQPERLEEVLASVLDRRQDRTERRRAQIAELNQRAAETDLRLKRLYDAIESGIADLADPALKDRIAGLKAIRDQARTDAERAQATLESSGNQSITPDMVRKFASTARERMRVAGGGYRRDHLRALAQRVEVADREVRIMGSKGDLLRTLTAASGSKSDRAPLRGVGLVTSSRSPAGLAGFVRRPRRAA
jgi:hypothetical protein